MSIKRQNVFTRTVQETVRLEATRSLATQSLSLSQWPGTGLLADFQVIEVSRRGGRSRAICFACADTHFQRSNYQVISDGA